MFGPRTFRFLNNEGDLDQLCWFARSKPYLWRYNLHYFDDLTAKDSASRASWHHLLIDDWVRANPPFSGVGWEPYPTSLRIVNWIKWSLAGNSLSELALQSLAIQTRWLERRMEWHLLGNHLLVNAKALFFASLFFKGDEADGWLEKAHRILISQLKEQVLDDGGHFELSPMYHALATEDVCDLINISVCYGRSELASDWRCHQLPKMLRWLKTMSHPDGDIGFFNDSAIGVAPANSEILSYANRIGVFEDSAIDGVTFLQNSGYLRLQAGEAVVLADFARVGPDYLPGHAHADTLSFEMSVRGRRIIVNSGTSVYEASKKREYQRSTSAHNTVVVNDENSSEVWSSFRVARRAKPFGVSINSSGCLYGACSHDGYTRLPGQPIHRREFRLSGQCLEIFDQVSGPPYSIEAAFHFHPDMVVEEISNGCLIMLPDGSQIRVICSGGTSILENSTWHPEFGVSIPSHRLHVRAQSSGLKTSIYFAGR